MTQIVDRRTFLWSTPRLLRRVAREDFDAILVGFPSHFDEPVAPAVGRSKGVPIRFDLLTSLWENAVIDGQSAARRSVRVARHRLYDSLKCRLADLVSSSRGLAFIGIGAQRSGTSWMHACVHDHPEICMPRKQTNFYTFEQLLEREPPGWRR